MSTTPTSKSLLDKMPALAARFRLVANMRDRRDKMHVLIVEDQLFSRKILEELLHHDYQVHTAASAKEGLQLYLEVAPDITLLDIELMDESGHSLAKIFRTLDPKAYIVMVTGNNSVEDVVQAKSNGVDGFIVKPYNKSKILECIDKFIALHAARVSKGPTA